MKMLLDNIYKDIPQQFHEKKNIEILIQSYCKQLEDLIQVFKDLDEQTTIDTALGVNLDNIGSIVNLTRKEAGLLAGIRIEEPVISDERYRQFLKYKILMNTNECTYYDLIEGIHLLWNLENVCYIEDADYPATIIFQTGQLDLDMQDLIEFHANLCIRASGVGIILRKLYETFFDILIKYEELQLDICNYIQRLSEKFENRLEIINSFNTEVNVDNSELTVEKDLWFFDGTYKFDGTKKWDAKVTDFTL